MQHETVSHFRAADDSGESNRPCSPRPGNNSEPLCRPIQRSGSSRLSGIVQLVSGSGKGQNLNNLHMYKGPDVLIKRDRRRA